MTCSVGVPTRCQGKGKQMAVMSCPWPHNSGEMEDEADSLALSLAAEDGKDLSFWINYPVWILEGSSSPTPLCGDLSEPCQSCYYFIKQNSQALPT